MKNVKTITRPYYTNDSKTQIDVIVEMESGVKSQLIINKKNSDGTVNSDWEWIHERAGEGDIEGNTKEFLEEREAARERNANAKQRIADEELFNLKLEIFEIEEIRASKNTKMKSKIRRSGNKTQAMIYAAALVNKEMDKPAEDKPAAEKKPATKKRAPAKKKTATKKVNKVTIVDTINDDKRD